MADTFSIARKGKDRCIMMLADLFDNVGRDFLIVLALVFYLIWKMKRTFGDEKMKQGAKIGFDVVRQFWNKH